MQINVALQSNHRMQADLLRKAYFPNTTSAETRDSFVFSRSIESFQGDMEELLSFIEKDVGGSYVQRMITMKNETYARLKSLSVSLERPIAATFRAIIAWSVAHIDDDTVGEVKPICNAGTLQLLYEKIQLLETQIETSHKTLDEIKRLLEEAKKGD